MTAAKLQDSTKEKVAKKATKSKRQKRMEGSHPSTSWPQQPKIKSMEARDKAYLRTAGFGNVKKSQAEKKGSIDPEKDFINSPEYKFGRLLASPETRTRHATVLKLKQYLQARTDPQNSGGGLSVLDLMKLWKGMWHTLYLCDGVAVQNEVSKVLAELMWAVGGTAEEDEYAGRLYLEMEEGEEGMGIDGEVDDDGDEMQIVEMDDSDEDDTPVPEEDSKSEEKDLDEEMEDEDEEAENPANDEQTKHCRGAHLSALYVRTYLRTLTREWSNMDKYRIDKFYTLTRLMLREAYRYAASRHWNLGIIRLFNDAIFEEVLRTKGNDGTTRSYGNGIRFHVLDVSLEELARVNAEKETGLPLTEATFLDCLEPFFAMAQRCEQKLVHQRVVEKVIMRFLEEYSVVSDNYDENGDKENGSSSLIMDQVHVGTVGQFIFELASDTETVDRYRSQLYDIHKTYMRRIKLVGRDVDMSEQEEEDDAVVEEAMIEEEKQEEEETVDQEQPEDKKSKKKKKKKRKKESPEKRENDDTSESITVTEEEKESQEEIQTTVVEDTPTKKKKKKSKKASKKEKESAPMAALTEEEEEIITISKKEQKAAARAVAKAAKAAAKAKEADPTTPEKSSISSARGEESVKRVKFGKMNMSKSYKASIKDLKKVNPRAILEKTPEKSILLKRDKKKRKKSS